MDKNLVLKATKENPRAEDEETTYIVKRVIKALRKSGDLSRKGKSSRHTNEGKENDTCHKCGKLGHYIKDCSMHKVEYKKYVKQEIEKERCKDRFPVNYSIAGKLKLAKLQIKCWQPG